jgi:hypothetical protein
MVRKVLVSPMISVALRLASIKPSSVENSVVARIRIALLTPARSVWRNVFDATTAF